MDNQHKHIKGYRDLTPADINTMNGIKELEAQFNGMIDWLRGNPQFDQRHVAIAATAGEEAFMRAVRAVAQPERIVTPIGTFTNFAQPPVDTSYVGTDEEGRPSD